MKLKITQFKKPKVSYLTIAAVFLNLVLPFIAFADTNPYSDALKATTTLLFAAFFTLFGAITLLAIAVMLFIRYIALTILLILSPLVWLCWILPSTKEYWSKWWHNFLKWAMFLPAVLFFLYLTVATIGKFPDMLVKYAGPQRNLPNQGFAIDVAYIADLVAILGLLIGGLYTANALGIYGAKTFYGWSQGAGKMFGGWVGKRATGIATAPFRAKAVRNKMEEWQKGIAEGKYKGVGKYARSVMSRPLTWAQQKGGNLVEEAKKDYAKQSSDQLALAYASATRPGKAAIAEILAERKRLDKLPGVDMASYKRFGRDPDKITRVNPLLDEDVARAIKAKDVEEVKKALVNLFKKFKPDEWGKMQIMEVANKGLHSGISTEEWKRGRFKEAVLRSVVDEEAVSADEFAKIIRPFRAGDRKKFINDITVVIPDAVLEKINPSIHKYIKSGLGQEIFLGATGETPAAPAS